MMEMVEAADGHETKLVTMSDRATQTEEPYEPNLDMEHKEKKPRGRKRKSMEDAAIDMDPSVPRMDGIDFKHVDQLASPKRKRLREEKIKPIEELTFLDIKKYNRNQLRAYCSIYGVKRKRKGEMEFDLARYAALFHPGESEYDVAKFQPTEYSGIPIARKRSGSEGGNSPYSPATHNAEQVLQTMHDGQLMSSSVEPGVLSAEPQHIAHHMAQQMSHAEHHPMHGGEHQMGQLPVAEHPLPEGQLAGEHQIPQEHHLPQEHQMGAHAMNDHHQIGSEQQLADDQNLPSEQHMVSEGHLPNEQHMSNDQHIGGEPHMGGEQHMTNEQHLGGDQHLGAEHINADHPQIQQEHQLAGQETPYAEMQQGGTTELGAESSTVLSFQVHNQAVVDGSADGTELEGSMVHPTHVEHQEGAEHTPHADQTAGAEMDEAEVGEEAVETHD